ncbi:MAG TPA: FG-GAP-like repeat-containing protein [Acidobacteriaceae bacterium]
MMLPRIQAQRAQDRAQGITAQSAAAGVKLHPQGQPYTGSTGVAVNFPGFLQPPWFTVADYNQDSSEVTMSLTADVNKDGKPDLVNITDDGTVNVVLNTGSGFSGTAMPTVYSSITTFNPTVDFASAVDLNKDGYPDIEVVDTANAMVYILMNKGDGTFANAQQINLNLAAGASIDSNGFSGDVIFADVTNDGTPDMIVLSGQPSDAGSVLTLQVYVGVGDGTFPTTSLTPQTQTIAGAVVEGSYHSMQAVDMNGDGKVDLVFPAMLQNITGTFGYTYVLTGNGNGVFSTFPTVDQNAAASYAVGVNNYLYESYVGKVSSAATAATVVVAGEDGIYSQVSNGDGTLQAPVFTPIGTLSEYNDVLFADLNGDGKVDLMGSNDGFFAIYTGNGDGTFSSTITAQYAGGDNNGNTEPLPADFDGDGKVDVVFVGGYGDAGLFHGTGLAGIHMFDGAPILGGANEDAYNDEAVVAGNFTGSGYNDVLFMNYNYNISSCDSNCSVEVDIAINDGRGNFTYKTALSHAALNSIGWSFVYPMSIDINNDGKQDMLISTGTGLYYALSNGDGTFTNPVALPLPGGSTIGCNLNYGAVKDLNKDGKQDIVVAYGGCESGDEGAITASGFLTWMNNGDGTFTPSFTGFGNSLYSVDVADFNNDGKLDLIALDSVQGDAIYVVPGNGDGSFNTAAYVTPWTDSNIFSVAIGDYDGDGNQDIAMLGYVGSYGVTLLKGNGDLTFSGGPAFFYGTYVYAGQFADFNTDGRPDLVLDVYPDYAPYESFAYSINLGGGAFSDPTMLYSAYDESEGAKQYGYPLIVADFNGDGAPDVLAESYYSSGFFYNTGAITMTLSTSAASTTQDASITLTATLTPTVGSNAATGTVTFYDNGTAIGTGTLSGNVATLTLSTLPVGNNVITAVYSGDVHYNAATSTASVNGQGGSTTIGVGALPASFSMTAVSGATLNLTVGETGTATFTVTGNATFTGAITFSCSGVPAGTSCTILPGTINLTGAQSATVAVVLDTTAPNNHFNAGNLVPDWMRTTGGITLAAGVLLLLPLGRRRNTWPLVLFAVLGLGAAVSLSGCAHKYEGTPAGTYTVNVVGTSGSITQTSTISMTIHK